MKQDMRYCTSDFVVEYARGGTAYYRYYFIDVNDHKLAVLEATELTEERKKHPVGFLFLISGDLVRYHI